MDNKKLIIILAIFIFIVAGLVAVYFIFPEFGSKVSRIVDLVSDKPMVIENEKLVIPNTQKINGMEGRLGNEITETTIQTPLVPKTEAEKVIVAKAILTVKGSYNLAKLEAEKWTKDALPSLVNSLGAVTLDGKSSQWQIAFSAKSKPKKGYEIIIQGDQIVSKKEIDSTAVGAVLPLSFKDSDTAIVILQELPRFSDATLSAINLYYNTDGKIWRYTLTTSKGGATVAAQ